MSEKKLTSLQIADKIQYWYSKWYNSVTKDERKIYGDLYKAYENLENYYKEHNFI
jgi:hypothetical protein